MKKTFVRKTLQQGFGMVELAITLIVVLVLLAVAYSYFADNMRKTAIQSTTGQVTTIASSLKQKYGQTNLYGQLTTAIAVQSRTIPEDLRITGTNTAQNSYGGAITVAPVTLTQANDAASLTFQSIPQEQCMDIVTGTERVARRVTVAGTIVKPLAGVLNTATLAAQCESATAVDVVWDVGRS